MVIKKGASDLESVPFKVLQGRLWFNTVCNFYCCLFTDVENSEVFLYAEKVNYF